MPRLLGAQAFGEVTIALTIATLATTASGLGVSEFLVRRAAQRPHTLQRDAGVAFAIQMITAVVCMVAVLALARALTASFLDEQLLVVSLLPILGAPAQTVLLSAFRGREQHKSYAWFNAIGVVLTSVGAVAVLLAGGDVVAAIGVGNALPIAFTLLAWKLTALRPSISFDRTLVPEIGEFIRGGFPFLTWQLTLAAYGQIDKVLLGALVPAAEVGWYGAAYRIIGIVVFIPTLVIAPLFPALSRSAKDWLALRRTIARTLKLLLLLMVGLGAGTVVAAPAVPGLLGWPADFDRAVPLMMILALHEPFVAVDMVLGVVLMAIHREARWVLVGVGATVFNAVANLLAIPLFQQMTGNGAIGAAIVTLLTEVLMFFGALSLIPKPLLDPSLIWQAGRLFLAGIAAAAVGVLLLPLTLLIAAPAAALTYVSAVLLMRVMTVEDLGPLGNRVPWLSR
jgi:O-antigen/teichoic acid export membrane protein